MQEKCIFGYLLCWIKKKKLQHLQHQEEPAVTPTFSNQNMQNVYGIQQNMKVFQTVLPQLPSAPPQKVYGNKIPKTKQTPKKSKNVHVTPQVNVILPQHSYNLHGDINSNEVSLNRQIFLLETSNIFLDLETPKYLTK